MLELAVLGLLKEQPMHGYDLRKRLRGEFGPLANLSFGSLYPALSRLERNGAVRAIEHGDRPGGTDELLPLTGSLGGERATLLARRATAKAAAAFGGRGTRARKIYEITPRGEALFDELLSAVDANDDAGDFSLRLAFARHLSPPARVRLLERRRIQLDDRLQRSQSSRNDRVLDHYEASIAEHARESIERDLQWIEKLLVNEQHPNTAGETLHAVTAPRPTRRDKRCPNIPWEEIFMTTKPRIKVAIAGVGNCACSLIQGIEYYRDADPNDDVPGLMHVELGGYHVGDVDFVAAFDVDADKVGLDLGKAVFAGRNNTIRFAEVPSLGVTVQRGPTLDGLGKYYRESINESPESPVDVTQVLRDSGADVLVSYLPVGSEDAQKFYAQAAIDAHVAFVNAIPVFIASDPEWAQRFTDAGVPIIGDDIKSQVGATILHRVLARLFEDRGTVLDRTYQLNVGGNMDFKNMLERERLLSKKISKTQSVTSQIDRGIAAEAVHIGPSDHVEWLEDRKWAYIRLEGRNFGDVPLNLELKLEVWDSPNSAGVIIDAIRCARLALDRGIGGPLLGPSAYFMKSPPVQYRDEDAHWKVEQFAAGEEE